MLLLRSLEHYVTSEE